MARLQVEMEAKQAAMQSMSGHAVLKQKYDEKLVDLQAQRDELQRERYELQQKLEALQHASGATGRQRGHGVAGLAEHAAAVGIGACMHGGRSMILCTPKTACTTRTKLMPTLCVFLPCSCPSQRRSASA